MHVTMLDRVAPIAWVSLASLACVLPGCAASAEPSGAATGAQETAGAAGLEPSAGGAPSAATGGAMSEAAGGTTSWGTGGAASAAASGGVGASGGSASAGSSGGGSAGSRTPSSPSVASATDAGAAGGACSPTDIADLLATTDGGASILLTCLLTTCLIDVVGQVAPCLSKCLQANTPISARCGDCVGRETQSARDACIAQCADDPACYGDCAISSLMTAGQDCVL